MQLSDLIGNEELSLFREARWQAYSARAIRFLRQHFARAVASLPDETLQHAVYDAAVETRQAGLRSEREHLQFLIPYVMLGRRFTINPLYLDLLYNAGWIDDAGRPSRSFSFETLFEQIEIWDQLRSADMTSARQLAVRFARLYEPNAPEGIAALHQILPTISGTVRQEPLTAFMQAASENGQAVALEGPDLQAFCCVSALLGIEFHKDPLFTDVGQALNAHSPGSDERRLAFGDALRKILLTRLGETHNAT